MEINTINEVIALVLIFIGGFIVGRNYGRKGR
jgi:hypothetical protein